VAKVLDRSLYQTDYYAWTKQQAAALRALAEQRANSTLDLQNLAEEVESLGRSDLNTVRSQVRRIIEHLLKLEYSPTAQPRLDWRDSVDETRDDIEDHITASMFPDVAADLDKLFGRGRRAAASGLIKHGEREAATALPTSCPYSLEQILEQDWYPQNRHGLADG
jgi:phosphoglycolate phosphatase-like HAD superfamily hydrolase